MKRFFGVPKSRYSADRFVLSDNDIANLLCETIRKPSQDRQTPFSATLTSRSQLSSRHSREASAASIGAASKPGIRWFTRLTGWPYTLNRIRLFRGRAKKSVSRIGEDGKYRPVGLAFNLGATSYSRMHQRRYETFQLIVYRLV